MVAAPELPELVPALRGEVLLASTQTCLQPPAGPGAPLFPGPAVIQNLGGEDKSYGISSVKPMSFGMPRSSNSTGVEQKRSEQRKRLPERIGLSIGKRLQDNVVFRVSPLTSRLSTDHCPKDSFNSNCDKQRGV